MLNNNINFQKNRTLSLNKYLSIIFLRNQISHDQVIGQFVLVIFSLRYLDSYLVSNIDLDMEFGIKYSHFILFKITLISDCVFIIINLLDLSHLDGQAKICHFNVECISGVYTGILLDK